MVLVCLSYFSVVVVVVRKVSSCLWKTHSHDSLSFFTEDGEICCGTCMSLHLLILTPLMKLPLWIVCAVCSLCCWNDYVTTRRKRYVPLNWIQMFQLYAVHQFIRMSKLHPWIIVDNNHDDTHFLAHCCIILYLNLTSYRRAQLNPDLVSLRYIDENESSLERWASNPKKRTDIWVI